MKRGEIYYIQSNYQETGSEQRAGRPAVIVSGNLINNNSEVVEVVYLTTRPKTDLNTHVLTRSAVQPSTILCEQIYSVSKQRIDQYVGTLTEKEMQEVDIALAISLGLDFGATKIMREPTEEELEKIRESVRQEFAADPTAGAIGENPDKPQKPKEEKPKAAPDAQTIKIKAERDLYKKFSEDLVEILKAGRVTHELG